ncbi:MAG: thioredoxin:protein disulfide reductase [Thermodesulfobacteriota bacterium]|nr:thioredoxin:protein disulfide reductase [Thermodesulfobacteriota bacterium]
MAVTFRNHSMTARWVRVACILLILFFVGSFPSWAATVQVETLRSMGEVSAGGAYPVRLRIRVAPLWYIHGAESGHDGLVPTRLSFTDSPLFQVTDIQFPAPEKRQFPYAKDPLEVLSGEFQVSAQIVLSKDAPSGQQEITGTFSYQACSPTSCLPPETVPVTLSLTVVPPGGDGKTGPGPVWDAAVQEAPSGPPVSGSASGAGLWLALIGIFFGGLALNLTPCIYPLIPITVSYFGGKGRKSGKAMVIQGLVYICGLAVTNSILGVMASLSGAMLGSALQNPIVLMAVAGILVGLATSFFGLWEIRLPSGLTRLASRNYGGYFGTFFMGLTLGIVAAPCLGPFILGLLTYVGQKGDPFLGFLYFFVLSIGMGLPLAVLAVFSGALERLPISGGWMEWIRKILGWVLVGMAGYLLQPLIPDPEARMILFTAIAVAAGLHLGWLDRARHGSPVFSKVKKGLGAVLIAGAMAFFFVAPRHVEGVPWVPYGKGMLSAAVRQKRPVILDFYADWCGPCKAMERNVFAAPEVMELSRHFLPIRVDLTQRHPDQEILLKRYQIRGVPTILFLDSRGTEEKGLRIESYVGKDEVLRRMKQAADPTLK